jgi:hypothetical protein
MGLAAAEADLEPAVLVEGARRIHQAAHNGGLKHSAPESL